MSDDEDVKDVDEGGEEEEEEETAKKPAGKKAGAAAKKAAGFPLPKDKPRFEVKKWQAVALWSWGTFARHSIQLIYLVIIGLLHTIYCKNVVPNPPADKFPDIAIENCAICKERIQELCKCCLRRCSCRPRLLNQLFWHFGQILHFYEIF